MLEMRVDQLTSGARNTAELKGQNHLSGWDSKTSSVLHTQLFLEITSGVEEPSLREEGVHTFN